MANTDSSPAGSGAQGSSHIYDYNASPNTRAAISQKVRILSPVYRAGETNNSLLYQLGVVNSFTYDLSRSAEPIRGIGFGDQIAERVPGVQDAVDVSMERTLLYLSNAHQAFGFAGGVDGPVRTLQHHRWPFDMEQQLVFSAIADADLSQTLPLGEASPDFQRGVKDIDFSGQNVTGAADNYGADGQKHKAIITYFEACWMTSVTGANVTADASIMSESISAAVSDIHDLFSTYGEFLPTGNDPSLGQVGTIRYNGIAANGAVQGSARDNAATSAVG